MDNATYYKRREQVNQRMEEHLIVLQTLDEWDLAKCREWIGQEIKRQHDDLLVKQLELRRDQGGGPKGPRLPGGVTFGELLPHLSEARKVREAANLDVWCKSHAWPDTMQVNPGTLRKWLARYTRFIDDYETLCSCKEKHATI